MKRNATLRRYLRNIYILDKCVERLRDDVKRQLILWAHADISLANHHLLYARIIIFTKLYARIHLDDILSAQ